MEEEEEEEEEMDIEDEMDDLEIINPYKIEDGELPPPRADSDSSSDSEPEVEAETRTKMRLLLLAPLPVHLIVYNRSQVPPMWGVDHLRRSETREHHELNQSVSTLEDQMRGLMLEDKEEKERLKKKLRVSQQEKEQIEQAFRHVVDWIRKQFGVMNDEWLSFDLLLDVVVIIIVVDSFVHNMSILLHNYSSKSFFVCCDRNMPPKAMSQAAIERLITQTVNAALEAKRASRANAGGKEAMQ
nr:hypothetical protein [Tanacetum cinerariifolium]